MARHHERGRRGDWEHDHATGDEEQAPSTQAKQAADGMAADAAARRMAASVDGDDAAMVVDDVGAQRIQLHERADRYVSAVRRAVDKFQAILRRRHAESVIEKKIGWRRAGEMFKEHALDYLQEKLTDGAKEAAKELELTPALGGVVKAVGKVKGVVDDNAKAEQAEAEIGSVDDIVIAMERLCDGASAVARQRIGDASPEELARWIAQPERLPNETEVVARLDAMLLEAMRESGTQTVGESLAALKDRAKLGGEIGAVEKKWSDAQ